MSSLTGTIGRQRGKCVRRIGRGEWHERAEFAKSSNRVAGRQRYVAGSANSMRLRPTEFGGPAMNVATELSTIMFVKDCYMN